MPDLADQLNFAFFFFSISSERVQPSAKAWPVAYTVGLVLAVAWLAVLLGALPSAPIRKGNKGTQQHMGGSGAHCGARAGWQLGMRRSWLCAEGGLSSLV